MIYIDLDSIKPNPRAGSTVSYVNTGINIELATTYIPEWFMGYHIWFNKNDHCENYINYITVTSNDENFYDELTKRRQDLDHIIDIKIEYKTIERRHNPLPRYLYKYQHHKPCTSEDGFDYRTFETLEHALMRLEKRNRKGNND